MQKPLALTLVAAFAATLFALYSMGSIPMVIVGFYAVASGLSFLAYAKDKSAARQGRWRTPENTLHLLDLMGGWPGGRLAQVYLRHKTKKVSFRVIYWLTVIANVCALLWTTTPEGRRWLERILSQVG